MTRTMTRTMTITMILAASTLAQASTPQTSLQTLHTTNQWDGSLRPVERVLGQQALLAKQTDAQRRGESLRATAPTVTEARDRVLLQLPDGSRYYLLCQELTDHQWTCEAETQDN